MRLSRGIRPPVVADVGADELGLALQSYATLHERLLQLLDLLEVAIGHSPSLLKGHSLSEGWSSGEWEGKNSRCIPSGTFSFFFAVCHPALSTTSRMRFFFPARTSLAKCSKANENTSAPTVGRINQWTSPPFGRAK